MSDYNYTVKIRDKQVKFRKWKVKDKKAFIQAVNTNDTIASNNIVYDCIENKKLALSFDEIKFILMNVRSVSIGETLNFEIECSSCGSVQNYEPKILDIMTPEYEKFDIISSGNVSLKMDEIANKDYYDSAMGQCNNEEETFLIDFLYHIKELNGSDAFSFEQLFNYVNNLDIDVGEDLFSKWKKMKFTFNNIKEVECPSCGEKEPVQFDELYGFFPDAWFE